MLYAKHLLLPCLHCSGRELFLSDSSLFVDDAEAYEKYQRVSESDVAEQKVKLSLITGLYLFAGFPEASQAVCEENDIF